ncbi:MAG: DUF4917 family protein [Gammaproteobacteria bacterium]|nr:DUF4917 family protein [Gammaproteobacteria bacterium]
MTQTNDIVEWSDIADEFGDTLLIGNGGSIALSNNFSYTNLYKFGVERGEINSCIQDIFQEFSKVRDFEKLLRRLWEADFINKKFDIAETEQAKVRKPYTDVRRALINTVKDIHPDQEQLAESLSNISKYCSRFSKIFTLNYDLTLIWAIESSNKMAVMPKKFSDGFSSQKMNTKLNSFTYDGRIEHSVISVYYLHGNLCLCQTKATREEKKLAAEDVGGSLLKQLTDYWAKNDVQPLFVCEGGSREKLLSITQSNYLYTAYENLELDRSESLAIYGWSISDGDQHILDAIKKNRSLKRVAVSVYKDDKKFQDKAKQALREIGIESIRFFDSESSGCWANLEQLLPI